MKKMLCLCILAALTCNLAQATPAVRPHTGGPSQTQIDAQLRREKEALPPYPVKSAQELWQEGESLFAKKQYGEGVLLMRASLKASAEGQKQEKLAQYEAELAQQKKKAQELRQQGKDWQARGNSAKAVAAYQASLRVWPDVLLEMHVKTLNSPPAAKGEVDVVEMLPCGILDVSAAEMPAGFSLEYAPGTDRSDVRTVRRDEIFADGRLVRYSKSRASYHQDGPPKYETAAQRLPEISVRRLYAATQACAFNTLESHRKKNDANKWGRPWTLSLKVDGKQHSVGMLRAFVSRFELVQALFNKTVEGN